MWLTTTELLPVTVCAVPSPQLIADLKSDVAGRDPTMALKVKLTDSPGTERVVPAMVGVKLGLSRATLCVVFTAPEVAVRVSGPAPAVNWVSVKVDLPPTRA